EKCAGPCVDEVTPEAYQAMVAQLCRFLEGDGDEVVARLEREMLEAADALEFERAARLRDRLASVRKALERQQMVFDRPEDL
ncbi:MAG: UvrB/UvrC motif-containing protein, partial [Acidimicrobiales bacterium]|nr:UvrB/UvrC motif-containing protein [Acidimicrobiales bacterium]